MPEGDEVVTPPATTPAGNAPAFVDQSQAQEISRLNGLLETANQENNRLKGRVQELEGQVDEKKQQEMEARITALEGENQTLKDANAKLEGNASRTQLLTDLAGKVKNPAAVAALMTDEFRTKDGKVDVEKILATYPEQTPDGAPVPAKTDAPGGKQTTANTNLEKAVESKDIGAINAAFDAELKGANQ